MMTSSTHFLVQLTVTSSLFLLLLANGVVFVHGVYFHVKEGAERCFLEEVPAQTLVLAEYKSPDTHSGHWSGYEAPPTGIVATVKDPEGNIMLDQTLEAEGRFAFSAVTGGEHYVCLKTNTTNWGNREFRFYMNIKVGDQSTDYDEIAKMEHLSAIEVEVRKLNDKVAAVSPSSGTGGDFRAVRLPTDRKMSHQESSFRRTDTGGTHEEFIHRVSMLRQMSSEALMKEVRRDLDADELTLIERVAEQIAHLQQQRYGWLGNVVRRVRRAIGNPRDDDVETVVLPPANDILDRAKRKQELFKRRFGRGPRSRVEHGGDQVALENILSLDDALDGSLRFLMAYKLYQAKALLSLALRIYPQDLRLYKLYGWIILRDRTLNWQAVRLQQGLFFFDRIAEPDCEIWALRGDIGSALWKLERGQRHLVEQALVCYTQSFQMANNDGTGAAGASKHKMSAVARTYAVRKAAVLSSEVFALSMRESEVNQQAGIQYHRQTLESLQRLSASIPDLAHVSDGERYDLSFAKLFACLGLGQFDEATRVAALLAKELQLEQSTDDLAEEVTQDLFQSLVKIVLFSGIPIPPIGQEPSAWDPTWRLIRDLFAQGVRGTTVTRELLASSVRGRIGLSLSGGGLRAVFMHLGLMARMAECGMLKAVASLSCVSGGCLVGAHFYNMAKHLIETKYDDAITDEDMVVLVQKMIQHFWNATQHDMYAHTLINPIRNLRIAFGQLRRIQLLGDEFHTHIFRHAFAENDKAYNGVKWEWPWRMRDSVIVPKGWNQKMAIFAPRIHNWRRTTKAPALYLNATNLNTGHLFRFTGLYMGEKADMHGGDLGVNRNKILESVRYKDIDDPRYRNIAFADCVAISQLMPGVFDPYELHGLYGDLTVKLIDGGIFDNAGLASLLHANTDYLIANEMSASLKDLVNPSSSAFAVLLRILDISGDLNFERVLRYLKDRLQNWGVKDVCFVHSSQVDLMSANEREALYYNRRVPARTRDLRKRVISRMLHAQKRRAHGSVDDGDVRDGGGSGDNDTNDNDADNSMLPSFLKMDTGLSTVADVDESAPRESRDDDFGADAAHEEEENEHEDDAVARSAAAMNARDTLSLGAVLHSYLVDFRTSIDVITDTEKAALMATGYKLATEGLMNSSKSALSGGQFFRMVDVIPAGLVSPSSRGGFGKHFDFKSNEAEDNIPERLRPLAQLTGCGNGQWAFFDVSAPQRNDWVFSPMTELLTAAENVKIPVKNVSGGFSDADKVARDIRGKLNVTQFTDNPAMHSLFEQLSLAPIQLSVMRMLRVSWKYAIAYLLVPILLVAVIYGYGVYDFASFYNGASFGERSCLCIAERPLFYLLLFIAFIVLFIRPGYVSRILLATVVMPFYYFGTTAIFDPFLLRRSSLTTLMDLHRKYVVTHVRELLETPRVKTK